MKFFFIVIEAILLFQSFIVERLNIKIFSYFDEILILFLGFLFLISTLKRKTISKVSVKILILIVLFSVIGITSGICNTFNYLDFNYIEATLLAIKFFLTIFFVSNIDISIINQRKIIDVTFIFEKIVIIVAIFNFFFFNLYIKIFSNVEIMYRAGFISVTSIFNHPGVFGWFMLFCMFLNLSIYSCFKTKKNLKWLIIDSIFAILSMRSKVIVGMIVGLCVYFLVLNEYKNKDKLINIIKKISVVFMIFLICIFLFKNTLNKTYELYFTSKHGYSVRQALADTSFKIMDDYFPLGVGFGKYASWYASVNYSEYYYKYGLSNMYGITPDNTTYAQDTYWPSVFGETGFLGTIVMFLLMFCIFKYILKGVKAKNNSIRQISIFSILILIQTLLESLGSMSFNTAPQYIFVAIVIGIVLSNNRKNSFVKINEDISKS